MSARDVSILSIGNRIGWGPTLAVTRLRILRRKWRGIFTICSSAFMRWRCIVIYIGASPVTNTRRISGEFSIFFCAESIRGKGTTEYFSRFRHASLWNNWMKFFMAGPELEVHFIDQHFAALMNRLAKVPSPELELAAKLVSNFRARGDVCVPLRDVTSTAAEKLGGTEIPALRDWVNKLRSSGVVGDPGEFAPLIL